jgi:hypothetical protein
MERLDKDKYSSLLYYHLCVLSDRQTGTNGRGQTDRLMEIWTDGHTDKWMYKQRDRGTKAQTDKRR